MVPQACSVLVAALAPSAGCKPGATGSRNEAAGTAAADSPAGRRPRLGKSGEIAAEAREIPERKEAARPFLPGLRIGPPGGLFTVEPVPPSEAFVPFGTAQQGASSQPQTSATAVDVVEDPAGLEVVPAPSENIPEAVAAAALPSRPAPVQAPAGHDVEALESAPDPKVLAAERTGSSLVSAPPATAGTSPLAAPKAASTDSRATSSTGTAETGEARTTQGREGKAAGELSFALRLERRAWTDNEQTQTGPRPEPASAAPAKPSPSIGGPSDSGPDSSGTGRPQDNVAPRGAALKPGPALETAGEAQAAGEGKASSIREQTRGNAASEPVVAPPPGSRNTQRPDQDSSVLRGPESTPDAAGHELGAVGSANFDLMSKGVPNRGTGGSTTPPAASPAEPVPAEKTLKPAADGISLVLPGRRDGGVKEDPITLRLVQRGDEVRVAVRTPDPGLSRDLQRDLSHLMERLDHQGFRGEAWRSGSIPAATSASRESAADGDRRESNGSGGQSSSQQGGHGQSRRDRGDQRQPTPEWVEELEQFSGR